jgi:sterol desaturase/sphingolipid hydroxylase (fatty acid hydroxylase superfamily)
MPNQPKSAKELYPSLITNFIPKAIIYYSKPPFFSALAVLLLQPLYYRIAAAFPYDDIYFYAMGSSVLHFFMWIICNGFYSLIAWKGWFAEYKLPRTARMAPSWDLIKATVIDAVVGQLIIGPVALYGLYLMMPDPKARTSPLPDFLTIYKHLVFAHVVRDVLFYWAHRMFHEVEFLYKAVHKQHHKYVGTIGISAEYAHPVEQILANFFPFMLYMIAFSVHPLIWAVWMIERLLETYEAHCGYCFSNTFLGKLGFLHGRAAAFHDFHHTENKGNYGAGEVMDHLFGTMDNWVLHKERLRTAAKEA